MNRIIIGLVGPMCSGKGIVGKHLKDLGFEYQSLSDRVREETRARGLPVIRENLQDVGNDLRDRFGGSVLAKRTLEILDGFQGNLVIDAIRNPAEIEFLKQVYDISIIAIDASREDRLQWYLERSSERGEDGVTPEDFYKADSRDTGIGEPENGQQVARCLEMSDIVFVNKGSKEELFLDIEILLSKNFNFTLEGICRQVEK